MIPYTDEIWTVQRTYNKCKDCGKEYSESQVRFLLCSIGKPNPICSKCEGEVLYTEDVTKRTITRNTRTGRWELDGVELHEIGKYYVESVK